METHKSNRSENICHRIGMAPQFCRPGFCILSSYRYYPPDVAPNHLIFHRLLSLFHPRPFILSRFPPQGTLAVVRARQGPFLDIYFRLVLFVELVTDIR